MFIIHLFTNINVAYYNEYFLCFNNIYKLAKLPRLFMSFIIDFFNLFIIASLIIVLRVNGTMN